MISIYISAFPPNFKDQLKSQGYTLSDEDDEKFERMKKAIMQLHCNSYLTASQKDSICKKLVKEIGKVAIPLGAGDKTINCNKCNDNWANGGGCEAKGVCEGAKQQ